MANRGWREQDRKGEGGGGGGEGKGEEEGEGEEDRPTKGDLGQYTPKGPTPSDLLPPARFHLLKFLEPPI
jgi:hypothetical protein